MGKVLIALCTVFLLAFPARGEQAVTWESLTVWNDLPPLYDPAPWPSDLAGRSLEMPLRVGSVSYALMNSVSGKARDSSECR